MGVSENGAGRALDSTRNSRILIIRTPKYGTPNFRKLPYEPQKGTTMGPVGKDEMNAKGV